MTRRLLPALADTGPVLVLAAIAAAGSFTHIRDTAREHGQHGWMAWAVAVCIDLTCVMAARERQRDKRTRRDTARLSWPTCVLVGGILLSLAANLAQAHPTVWGQVTAGTPAAAFLVAVSMLERRAAVRPPHPDISSSMGLAVPPSFGRPTSSPSSPSPLVRDGAGPELAASGSAPAPAEDGQTEIPLPATAPAAPSRPDDSDRSAPAASATPAGPARPAGSAGSAGPLAEFARRVADEHHTRHGRPITRDALRARLGVSNQLAGELLRQIRDQSAA